MARGKATPFMPEFTVLFEGPGALNSSYVLKRIHNRVSKLAVRDVMFRHNIARLPQHFLAGNWRRYDHMPRKAATLQAKRRRKQSPIDLVKSGRTKRHMEGEFPKVTVTGKGEKFVGKLMKTFPRVMKTNASGVGPEELTREVTAWSDDDVRDAAKEFQLAYLMHLQNDKDWGKKFRKRFGSRIAAAQASIG